jgi:hypothetical protein
MKLLSGKMYFSYFNYFLGRSRRKCLRINWNSEVFLKSRWGLFTSLNIKIIQKWRAFRDCYWSGYGRCETSGAIVKEN